MFPPHEPHWPTLCLTTGGTLSPISGGELNSKSSEASTGVQLLGQAELLMHDGRLTVNASHGASDAFLRSLTGVSASETAFARIENGEIKISVKDVVAPFFEPWWRFSARGNSEIQVAGGTGTFEAIATFPGSIFKASGDSKISISGGKYTLQSDVNLGIRAEETAEVVIVGGDFDPRLPGTIQDTKGNITGTASPLWINGRCYHPFSACRAPPSKS